MSSIMFFITYSVICRALFKPVVGDTEIVKLGMVALIMFGIAHSQAEDSHISIGLFVDKFNRKTQQIIDIIAYLSTCLVCFIISFVSFNIAINNMMNFSKTTDLLAIPLYPFRFIISIGFLL